MKNKSFWLPSSTHGGRGWIFSQCAVIRQTRQDSPVGLELMEFAG